MSLDYILNIYYVNNWIDPAFKSICLLQKLNSSFWSYKPGDRILALQHLVRLSAICLLIKTVLTFSYEPYHISLDPNFRYSYEISQYYLAKIMKTFSEPTEWFVRFEKLVVSILNSVFFGVQSSNSTKTCLKFKIIFVIPKRI